MIADLLRLEDESRDLESKIEAGKSELAEAAVGEVLGGAGRKDFHEIHLKINKLTYRLDGLKAGREALFDAIRDAHVADLRKKLASVDEEIEKLAGKREDLIRKMLESLALANAIRNYLSDGSNHVTDPQFHGFYQDELKKASALFPPGSDSLAQIKANLLQEKAALEEEIGTAADSAAELIAAARENRKEA